MSEGWGGYVYPWVKDTVVAFKDLFASFEDMVVAFKDFPFKGPTNKQNYRNTSIQESGCFHQS